MADHRSDPPARSGLVGGGEAGDLIRAKDWAATPLGAIEAWPTELQAVLSSPVPMVVIWGAEGILIYNHGNADVDGVAPDLPRLTSRSAPAS